MSIPQETLTKLANDYDEVKSSMRVVDFFYLRYLQGSWWAIFLSLFQRLFDVRTHKQRDYETRSRVSVNYENFVLKKLKFRIWDEQREIEQGKVGYYQLTPDYTSVEYAYTVEQVQTKVKKEFEDEDLECACNFPEHIDPNQNSFYVTCKLQGYVKCLRGENIKEEFRETTANIYNIFHMFFQWKPTENTLNGQTLYKPKFVQCDYNAETTINRYSIKEKDFDNTFVYFSKKSEQPLGIREGGKIEVLPKGFYPKFRITNKERAFYKKHKKSLEPESLGCLVSTSTHRPQ